MVGRLAGQVALVTGAARGIGAAIARAFVAEGATVWLTDLREPDATAHGGDARAAKLDVREEADWSRAVAAMLARDRRLDILVNNAGITGFEDGPVAQDPETATLAAWRAVHATNLDGVFLGCRAAIQAMRPAGRARSSTSTADCSPARPRCRAERYNVMPSWKRSGEIGSMNWTPKPPSK